MHVHLSDNVLWLMIHHGLNQESQEVMGLLYGDREEVDGQKRVVIWDACILRRSDRRKDRVEISEEQLVDASMQAEQVTRETSKETRVVGWYHSHPHITVLPSHVDVRTQANYQRMDSSFVGLIVSCFGAPPHNGPKSFQRVELIGFQSVQLDTGWERENVPISIIASPCVGSQAQERALISLLETTVEEEHDAWKEASTISDPLGKLEAQGIYQKSLCEMTRVSAVPLILALKSRLASDKLKMIVLEKELKEMRGW